jgi:hypothetical protein
MSLRASLLLSCFVTLSIAVLAANPVPFVNQPLAPTSTAPGASGFTLTVHGTGFVATSVVKWNGSARTTTFVSSSELQAAISSSDVASAGSASITVNSGGADSNAAIFWIATPVTSPSFASRQFLTASAPSDVVAADFNADGKADVVLANGFSSQSNPPHLAGVLLGNGDGTFKTPVNYSTAPQTFGVAIGDFNGDGHLDLAVSGQHSITSDWAFSTLLGNGDGTFQPSKYQSSNFRGASHLAVADFNRDGNLDIIEIDVINTNFVAVALGNGDGTFKPLVTSAIPGESYTAIGDLNGDGILDLVGSNTFSGPYVTLGNGDGTFQTPTYLNTTSTAGGVALADLNGDSKLDIVFGGNNAMVYVCLGNGDGTFQTCAGYSDDPGGFGYVHVVDLNADGKPDLIIGHLADYTFSYLLGNGDGTFQPFVKVPLSGFGPGPGAYAIGDFNGDGRADLVFIAGDSDNNNSGLYRLLQHP